MSLRQHLSSPTVIVFDVDDTLVPMLPEFPQHCNAWTSRRTGLTMDEAQKVTWHAYCTYGNAIIGLRHLYNWPESVEDEYMDEITAAYLAADADKLPRQPETLRLLEELAANGNTLAAFTANSKSYATEVITRSGLAPAFRPELIVGRHCIGKHHKTTPEAYINFQQTIRAHVPTGARLVMVEDSPSNLPAAKKQGFTTVLIGKKQPTPERAATIDFTFPTCHDAIIEMTHAA